MKKNTLFLAILTVLMLAACGNTGKDYARDTVQVPDELSGEDSIAYIENVIYTSPISVDDYLALAPVHTVEGYYFGWPEGEGVDTLPQKDRCAMQFVNRLMRMNHIAVINGNPMDKLRWAEAVNIAANSLKDCVPEWPLNTAPLFALKQLEGYSNTSQVEMNFMSYEDAVLDYYYTIDSYRQWLNEVPSSLHSLAQEEYEAWVEMNEARFALWRDVSYRQEWYSMKPMEIEYYYSLLAQNRRDELALERDIILNGKTYAQQGKTVTSAEWERWLRESSRPEDYELLIELEWEDNMPDEETVQECLKAMKSTFDRWLKARQDMAAALPETQGKSYDNLTADMHSRLIGKLAWLSPFNN